MYFFPYLEPVYCCMSSSKCCFLEAGKVVWYSHLFKNFPQFVVIHIVKGFGVINKAEVDVFLELSCFLDDPVDVGNLISGSSAFSKSILNIWKFMVHIGWSLAWRILSITLLAWVQLCGSLSILWHCLSLGLEWKLTFPSPVATAEFSKFGGIVLLCSSGYALTNLPVRLRELDKLRGCSHRDKHLKTQE